MLRSILSLLMVTSLITLLQAEEGESLAPSRLMTRWGRQLDGARVWPEYPRPQMRRKRWLNLNGLWEYAVRDKEAAQPARFDGSLLVPFAIQSQLSGVCRPVTDKARLWYRRSFVVPNRWRGQRVLAHFGAVDWEAVVWVNGRFVGRHRGGYDPFAFDITSALQPGEQQTMVVAVWDPTNKGYQPRGKQVLQPHGIWYTAVTGIWQTVWLEPVPRTSIARLKLTPDVQAGVLRVEATLSGPDADLTLAAAAGAEGVVVAAGSGPADQPLSLHIPRPRLWSPDDPFLYDLRVELRRGDGIVDAVDSYFGMRQVSLGKDEQGITRILLNSKPLFQFGQLDQGWWPDGLYTAPSDEALAFDVEMTRRLGYNMARKHVKFEPLRWYYHCDRLGLLVWQDMPSGDRGIRGNQPDLRRTSESAENYRREFRAIIDAAYNHPCIVTWIPFNEGWGQFDTEGITAWLKAYDPTRLVDPASGWADRGVGDIRDIHRYPGPAIPSLEDKRAAVLGEFGGLGWPVPGHLWWNKRNWGYRSFTSADELRAAYTALIERLRALRTRGLCAAVYTQTTDVEGEVNGLMTYDRAVVKMGEKELAAINRKVFLPPPKVVVVVPTSEQSPQTWRYTLQSPPAGWESAAFDDRAWKSAPGGFGARGTPGAVVRTEWKTKDIWLRRWVTIPDPLPADLRLRIHHDEDATVYCNSIRVFTVSGYTTDYVDLPVSAEGRAALRPGRNLVALHCKQTVGGQYIDLGFVEYREQG